MIGIGVGMFIRGSQTLALHIALPNSRGFLARIYTMRMDIGNFIGPVIFWAVIPITGNYPYVFALVPLIAFSAVMVVLFPMKLAKGESKS